MIIAVITGITKMMITIIEIITKVKYSTNNGREVHVVEGQAES